MDDVCRAIDVITNGTAPPDHITAANAFLMSFSDTPAAWGVCVDMLGAGADSRRPMAAHILHAKIEKQGDMLLTGDRAQLQTTLARLVRDWCCQQRSGFPLDASTIRVAQCISRLALHSSAAVQALLNSMLKSLAVQNEQGVQVAALLVFCVTLDDVNESNRISFSDRVSIRNLILTQASSLTTIIANTLLTSSSGSHSAIGVALQCTAQLQSPQIRFLCSMLSLQPLIDPLFVALAATRSPAALDIFSSSLANMDDCDADIVQEFVARGIAIFPALFDEASDDDALRYAVVRVATSIPAIYLFSTATTANVQWIQWVLRLTSTSAELASVCSDFWLDALSTTRHERDTVFADNAVFYSLAEVLFQLCVSTPADSADDAEHRQMLRHVCDDIWSGLYFILGAGLFRSGIHSAITNRALSWRSSEVACEIVATLSQIMTEVDDWFGQPDVFLSLMSGMGTLLSSSNEPSLVGEAARAIGNCAFVLGGKAVGDTLLLELLVALSGVLLKARSANTAEAIVIALHKVVDRCDRSQLVALFAHDNGCSTLVLSLSSCVSSLLDADLPESLLARRLAAATTTMFQTGGQPAMLDSLVEHVLTKLASSPNAFLMLGGILEIVPPARRIHIGSILADRLPSLRLADQPFLDGFGLAAHPILSSFDHHDAAASELSSSRPVHRILDALVEFAPDSLDCARSLSISSSSPSFLRSPSIRQRLVADLTKLTNRSLSSLPILVAYLDLGAQVAAVADLSTIPPVFFETCLRLLGQDFAHEREVVMSALAVWNVVLALPSSCDVVQRHALDLSRLLLSAIANWAPRNHISHLTETLAALMVRLGGLGDHVDAEFVARLPSQSRLTNDCIQLFLQGFRRLSTVPNERRRFIAMMQDFSDVCHAHMQNCEILVGYQL